MYSRADVESFMDKKFEVQNILPETIDIRYDTTSRAQLDLGNKKIPYSLTRNKVKCTEIEYILPEKPQNLSFLTLSVIPLK